MLKDKVVVIAGGAGLIGKSFVKSVLENGAKAVIADINEAEGKKYCDELKTQFSSNVEFVKFDLCDKDLILKCIDFTLSNFGKIDAAINAAYPRTKDFGAYFFDASYEDFCKNTNMQLGGAFLFMQEFARFFKTKNAGNIIMLSSIQGVVAPKFETYKGTDMSSPIAYSAIKAGLIHMVKYLAKYLKGYNIRVNCISPGGILDGQNPIFLQQYKNVCLNKGMLDPIDIFGAALFLLSDASAYVNGQNIVVDDGFCL